MFAHRLIAGIAAVSLVLAAIPSFAAPEGSATAAKVTTPKPAAAPRKPAAKPAAVAPAKPAPPTRPDFTAEEQAVAEIPGMPDVRFHADDAAAFERALPATPGLWLVLSTGGEDGAFGAGFIKGWTASGQRPDFSVVTA